MPKSTKKKNLSPDKNNKAKATIERKKDIELSRLSSILKLDNLTYIAKDFNEVVTDQKDKQKS